MHILTGKNKYCNECQKKDCDEVIFYTDFAGNPWYICEACLLKYVECIRALKKFERNDCKPKHNNPCPCARLKYSNSLWSVVCIYNIRLYWKEIPIWVKILCPGSFGDRDWDYKKCPQYQRFLLDQQISFSMKAVFS